MPGLSKGWRYRYLGLIQAARSMIAKEARKAITSSVSGAFKRHTHDSLGVLFGALINSRSWASAVLKESYHEFGFTSVDSGYILNLIVN